MAEQFPQDHANSTSIVPPEETKEHGCFGFMRKKEEKASQEDLVVADLNAAKLSKTGEEKQTLMDELQRTHTHSSSSSEEEVEEGGERKKKKKKRTKEAIQEKISGDKEGEETEGVPMEKCNQENAEKAVLREEKKEEDTQTPPTCEHSPGNHTKEKKGIIDKIKEKLSGHHKSGQDDSKED